MKREFLQGFLALPILFGGGGASAREASADWVFENARVVTVDSARPSAQAVAVRSGRIVAVGSNEAITPFIGSETERIDLSGRTVIPGLIDSHTHPTGASLTEFDQRFPLAGKGADASQPLIGLIFRIASP